MAPKRKVEELDNRIAALTPEKQISCIEGREHSGNILHILHHNSTILIIILQFIRANYTSSTYSW